MNIEREELECPCCGLSLATEELISKLRVARFHAGVPFLITSGTRCVRHNANIGGSPTSAHLLGFAADISVKSSELRFKIIGGLLLAGFNRILVYETFVHVDIDDSRSGPIIKLM